MVVFSQLGFRLILTLILFSISRLDDALSVLSCCPLGLKSNIRLVFDPHLLQHQIFVGLDRAMGTGHDLSVVSGWPRL